MRVDADDLDTDAEGGAAFAVGTVERLGAATMAKLRQWVGHHQVEILPVLEHAPPRRRRLPRPTRVDGTSSSSSATATASSPAAPSPPRTATRTTSPPTSRSTKADHPDKPTPTPSPACAGRHHRAKTASVWRYARTPEGHYLWHGPHNATYLVTDTGTHRL